jgi:hypothetical protein
MENPIFFMENSPSAASVSPIHTEAVREYSRNQTEHHKQIDFQTEYRRFCEKNGKPLDERYT